MAGDLPFEYSVRWRELADRLRSDNPDVRMQAEEQLEARDQRLEEFLKRPTPAPSGGLPRFWYVEFKFDGAIGLDPSEFDSHGIFSNPDDAPLFVAVSGGFQVYNMDTPGGAINMSVEYEASSGIDFTNPLEIDYASSANAINFAVPGIIQMDEGASAICYLRNFTSDALQVSAQFTLVEVSSTGWL